VRRVEEVYKSSEYGQEPSSNSEVGDIPNIADIDPNKIIYEAFQGVSKNVFSGLGEIKEDFSKVTLAVKNFPFRSFLTVAGVLALLYITFKIVRKFGIIKGKAD
jgi:hypothetical protein